jgi:hypothetical protein
MMDRERHTTLSDEDWEAEMAHEIEYERRAAQEEHDCDGMSQHEFEKREQGFEHRAGFRPGDEF